MLEQVVSKIEKDKPHCVMICPDWQRQKFWWKLQPFVTEKLYFPPGTRFFQLPNGTTHPLPNEWGVWAHLINGDIASAPTSSVTENEDPSAETFSEPFLSHNLDQQSSRIADTRLTLC